MTDTQEWAVVPITHGGDSILGVYSTFEKAYKYCDYLITAVQGGLGDRATYAVMSPAEFDDDIDPVEAADIDRQIAAFADSIDCPPVLYKNEAIKYLEAK